MGAFGLAERRAHGTPLIEPWLLQNRAFTNGLALAVVFFTAFGGLTLVLSLFTQLGLHFSPLRAGLTMAPVSLGAAIGAGSSFALIPRFGRKVLQAGLLVTLPAMAGARADGPAHRLGTTRVGSGAVAVRRSASASAGSSARCSTSSSPACRSTRSARPRAR